MSWSKRTIEIMQQNQLLRITSARDRTWKTVYILGLQCVMCIATNAIIRFNPDPQANPAQLGATWDDPTIGWCDEDPDKKYFGKPRRDWNPHEGPPPPHEPA